MVRPMSDQEEYQEKVLPKLLEKLENETPEEREQARKLLKAFLQENEQNPSKGTFSLPNDLVDAVMKEYGFTREEAEEEIEKFGG